MECYKFGEYVLYSDVKKLEAEATKWNDPQTQSKLELAEALLLAREKDIEVWLNFWVDTGQIYCKEEGCHAPLPLIDWYRKQKEYEYDEPK